MYTAEEIQIMNFGDAFTMIYGCISQRLMDEFGFDGERAVRKGTRYYGKSRGLASRETHLKHGLKINLENLFTRFYDLPPDPRFRRELQELNPQERVSHSLVCPMADTWAHYGMKVIGRIYCEEFHPACYGHYAYEQTMVNLGKTLTQDGDDYCEFNLLLRPEDMPPALRVKCFEEYDPDYVAPQVDDPPIGGREGFGTLAIKAYYYLMMAASEELGDKGEGAVASALVDAAQTTADFIRRRADENDDEVDFAYAEANSLFGFSAIGDSRWEEFSRYNAAERFETFYCGSLKDIFMPLRRQAVVAGNEAQ